MNRRNFLSLLTAGVAGIALDQAIPLGRVWSFPKKIVVPTSLYWQPYLESLGAYTERMDVEWHKRFTIGSTLRVRYPQRFIIRDSIFDPVTSCETITLIPADLPPDRQ